VLFELYNVFDQVVLCCFNEVALGTMSFKRSVDDAEGDNAGKTTKLEGSTLSWTLTADLTKEGSIAINSNSRSHANSIITYQCNNTQSRLNCSLALRMHSTRRITSTRWSPALLERSRKGTRNPLAL